MCGIMAIIPVPGHNIDLEAFNNLLEQSRKRGKHATGYCVYNDASDFAIVKEPGWFLRINPEDERIVKARVLIGHVRKASKGAFTDNWANHPHKVGSLVMVHNGTVPTVLERAKNIGLLNSTNNDTYAMLQLIHRGVKAGQTVEGAIAKVMSIFTHQDTAAIILLDTNNGELYLARSTGTTHRPLIVSPQNNQIVIASEEDFINDSYTCQTKMFGFEVNNTVIFKQGIVVSGNVFDINSEAGAFTIVEKIASTSCTENWLLAPLKNEKQQDKRKVEIYGR